MKSLKDMVFIDKNNKEQISTFELKKSAISDVIALKSQLAELGLWQDEVTPKTVKALLLLGKIEYAREKFGIKEGDLK